MKIATWNVNSVKARLPNLLEWLDEAKPDVALLQETKTVDETFPAMELEDRGYNCAVHGQKSYNGVAILSKYPLEDVVTGLPGNEEDEQARYIEAWVDAGGNDGVRVASIYLPNGNPTPGDKYNYKLRWMDHLAVRAAELLITEEAVVLGGDYNVIQADRDCYDPAAWTDDALFLPQTRAKFRTLLNLGYTEAWRSLHNESHAYSFWDYQAGAWQKDNGIRIDHFLLSPQATDKLSACEIDKGPRGKQKASDHTPVWCELNA
ncbi:MAG: exodeoxyribonuclease III [Alphaproteobacteria bacterium]|nr:exodeoxyribonuclease III [Alphaproteobacteria bacterium]